jgi:prostaglandin-endoperoxide synthase 2
MRDLRDLWYAVGTAVQDHADRRLSGVWAALERFPRLHRAVSRMLVGQGARQLPARPNPLSTMAPYTSWASLTDRTYDDRHLPPAASRPLPPVAEVTTLFARRGPMVPCPKSTVLFPCFAAWFVDGFLRSERVRREPGRNESNHDIDLMQIYGLTQHVTAQLRAGHDGLLRSQILNGEEYPPYLYSGTNKVFDAVTVVRDETITPEQRRGLFAVGSDTGNLQVGFVMMSVLFLREHNRIARQLKREYDWDDERLFQTARNILIVVLIKIVVEEYINHISDSRFRFLADPRLLRNARWYRPNWMAIEFNLLYRWHSLVPSTFPIGGRDVPIAETLFNPGLVVERGLAGCFEDVSGRPAGRIGLFNSDPAVLDAEWASIEQARAVKLRSYNAYRRLLRFPRATRFAHVSGDPQIRAALKRVYRTVDDIEFYAGIFAEDTKPNGVLPPLLGRMVAADAFSQAFTNPLLARRVFNPRTFSPLGWELVQARQTLAALVERNAGDSRRRPVVTMTRPDWART